MPEASIGAIVTVVSLVGAVAVPAVLWWADVIRPGSFVRAGLRDVHRVPGMIWLACGFSIFLAQQAGGALGAAAAVQAGLSGPDQFAEGSAPVSAQAVTFGCAYGVTLVAGILIVYLLAGRAGRGAGLHWRWRDPLLAAGLLVLAAPLYMAASAAVEIIARAVDPGSVEAIAHDTLRDILGERGTPWFWILSAAVVVGAPVAEEIVFRLCLQSALLRWTGSAGVAIGVTAVLFGLVHLGATPWYAVPVLALLGATWGIAFERTKRLSVPILMHAFFNAAQIGLGLLMPEQGAAGPN